MAGFWQTRHEVVQRFVSLVLCWCEPRLMDAGGILQEHHLHQAGMTFSWDEAFHYPGTLLEELNPTTHEQEILKCRAGGCRTCRGAPESKVWKVCSR